MRRPATGMARSDRPTPDDLDAIRAADSLADLAAALGVDSEHDAYLRAKKRWEAGIRREQEYRRNRALRRGRDPEGRPDRDRPTVPDRIPGSSVVIDGRPFHVHGITHAGTPEERRFLRDRVDNLLDTGAAIYCEQGIRRLYFEDRPGVCAMDDYRWAMDRCEQLGGDLPAAIPAEQPPFEGPLEAVDSALATLRESAFKLIGAGRERDVYGATVERALGDVATAAFGSHEALATGADFEAFRLRRRAARDPAGLRALGRYYERAFLPQPLEREWLRRHDRELEIVSHARNERMADYALYHAADGDAPAIHLIVGAAHGPGVRYYLEAYRDGRALPTDFRPR